MGVLAESLEHRENPKLRLTTTKFYLKNVFRRVTKIIFLLTASLSPDMSSLSARWPFFQCITSTVRGRIGNWCSYSACDEDGDGEEGKTHCWRKIEVGS